MLNDSIETYPKLITAQMGLTNIIHLRSTRICKDGVQDYQDLLISNLQNLNGSRNTQKQLEFSELKLNDLLFFRVSKNNDTFIHCQLPMIAWRFNFFLPLLIFLKLSSSLTKLVVTLHEWSNTHWLRRFINYFIIRQALLIIVPSEKLKQELQTLKFIKRKKIPIEVIPIGPNILVTNSEKRRGQKITKEGRRKLGHFGFLYSLKNPTTLLTVFKEIAKVKNDSELVFVGDFLNSRSKEKKRFHKLMESLGVKENVKFKGYLQTDNEVLDEMETWDVYISLHENGFSLRHGSTLAAMQLGIPIISYAPTENFSDFEKKWLNELIKGRNFIFISKELPIEKIAEVVLQQMNSNELRQSVSLNWIWEEIARMHIETYSTYLLKLDLQKKLSKSDAVESGSS
jgi:glycosyltransferase involved in cell wall biosynthesis